MSEDVFPCDKAALKSELEADEGRRNKRYLCPAGHWTIGVGHNLESFAPFSGEIFAKIRAENPLVKNALLDDFSVISDDIIDALLDEDIAIAIASLDSIWIGWRALSESRKRALINLCFQMGQNRLLGFVRFWRALKQYNFDRAASELVDSLWYRQTQPSRALRVVAQIKDEQRIKGVA